MQKLQYIARYTSMCVLIWMIGDSILFSLLFSSSAWIFFYYLHSVPTTNSQQAETNNNQVRTATADSHIRQSTVSYRQPTRDNQLQTIIIDRYCTTAYQNKHPPSETQQPTGDKKNIRKQETRLEAQSPSPGP